MFNGALPPAEPGAIYFVATKFGRHGDRAALGNLWIVFACGSAALEYNAGPMPQARTDLLKPRADSGQPRRLARGDLILGQ